MPPPSVANPKRPVPRGRRRGPGRWPFALATGCLVAAIVAVVLTHPSRRAAPTAPRPERPPAGAPPARPIPAASPAAAAPDPAGLRPAGPTLVDDDGRTPWASPTGGAPIPLGYLPKGCQLVLHVRPADLTSTAEGRRALAALGPAGARLVERAEALTGVQLTQMESLTVGLRGAGEGAVEGLVSVSLAAGASAAPPAGARRVESSGVETYTLNGAAWWAPPVDKGRRLVAGPGPLVQEAASAAGVVPPLRREVEALAQASDRDRHFTLLLAPDFLFTEGRALLDGALAPLRDPLFELARDELRAAMLSAHVGDACYLELQCIAAEEVPAASLAASQRSELLRWADGLQMLVLDANPAPHGRRVVARLPAMAHVLAEMARSGAWEGRSMVNAYLPAAAAHNLLMGGELLLAGLPAAAGTTGGAPPESSVPLAERLTRPVTVSFGRDTLEMALRYLSEELDAPVLILGGDLQLEGITRNQSFGLDARNRPAGEVLLEVLRLANPDKTATGPTDPKQKLVYVLKPDPQGVETVVVTTRAAAAQRGDPLPDVFRE